jgi:hypothetical protein
MFVFNGVFFVCHLLCLGGCPTPGLSDDLILANRSYQIFAIMVKEQAAKEYLPNLL